MIGGELFLFVWCGDGVLGVSSPRQGCRASGYARRARVERRRGFVRCSDACWLGQVAALSAGSQRVVLHGSRAASRLAFEASLETGNSASPTALMHSSLLTPSQLV